LLELGHDQRQAMSTGLAEPLSRPHHCPLTLAKAFQDRLFGAWHFLGPELHRIADSQGGAAQELG
jgi:hypothetical protein